MKIINEFMRGVYLVLFLTILTITSAHTQLPTSMKLPTISQLDTSVTLVDITKPVPVSMPDEKALRYYESGNILWIVNILWSLLIPVILLFTGLSPKIRTFASKLGKNWFLTIGIYLVVFAALIFISNLPLDYYRDFVRQHEYGLSNQTFGKWLADSLKELFLGVLVGFLLLWIPYLLLKRSPNRWWLYAGVILIPFIFASVFISPIWIEPMFNNYGPMKDKVLEAKILALANRAGIDSSRLFEVDKSVDTKKVNAYVTGFMGTRRIVLWDNTIKKLNEKELLFVMAHEMGHYVLGHIWKIILFLSTLVLIILYLIHHTAEKLIKRYSNKFRFDRLSDIASLPLFFLLISAYGFIVTPIANGFSRYIEHESDRFALEITKDNYNGAMSFVKMQQENLSNPRPGWFYEIWRADHPVLGDRIDFCNEYKPWAKGEESVYEKYFRK